MPPIRWSTSFAKRVRPRGFFGAKITGGGSGGTVAVLARKGASIDRIAEDFAQRSGHRPRVFTGSSPGAMAFGWLRLGPFERL